ncbi:MAG: TROVE domain-containing protein [Pyrinomonadaceae bacterium]|nr:TROVE domain-containing protein [Pyrinomonadaceae bacterium]MDQ3134296.1 RNA-binding protein [Acidobacteriota bacterium]
MANKNLFKSIVGKLIPATDARNEEHAPAYQFTPQQQLAQYAATGCLNSTFYANAGDQLAKALELCAGIEPEFIAKTAIYARERGLMKDMPALLCAVLSVRDHALFVQIFPRVIDNAKMLRNFVQIVRSGVVGRKSLGTAPKRMVREWLDARDEAALFKSNVGQQPSLADVLKMVHPKPANKSRAALYGYMIGRAHDAEALPEVARQFEAFKAGDSLEVPDVPFQMLTALALSKADWAGVARRASWQTTRMNLNTFARHGVFEQPGMAELVAERLSDEQLIAKARVFPYQLLAAYTSTDAGVPAIVREALQDAMEIATRNVPRIEGQVHVCPDVSGSMSSPVTGYRKGATTAVRCIDVAALVAATVLRQNPRAEVLPFEDRVVKVRLNARDSVMTNAQRLAAVGGGGTNCSAPLRELNHRKASGDLVIFVSDNESWVDAKAGRGTATMREWNVFKSRNPAARLVCIDVQPYATTQAAEREDILNVGGFSDQVFALVAEFATGRLNANHWVGVIEAVTL